MKGLYYFRNDFRLQDNALLKEACEDCDAISFVAKNFDESWGPWRKKFYFECLKELQQNLKSFGHDLTLIDPGQNLYEQIDLSPYDILYTPHISAFYESCEAQRLSKKIKVRSFSTDKLLIMLPYNASQLPDVFTDFRKRVEKEYVGSVPLSTPEKWPSLLIQGDPLNPNIEFPLPLSKSAFPMFGGENQALNRLHYYTFESSLIETYKQTRNGLIGTDYSTKLSAYLALGCLSPRQIFHHVELYEKEVKENQDTYWVKFELWWREYFRWVYEKYGRNLFLKRGIKNISVETHPNKELFHRWTEGLTDDDFVNANMIELKETGFMSNRGRQNVASYLVKDLKLPWTWGARYFEKVLIDYDVYSNWGNWQYVAGVGNDPRPNRYFNTQKQASMYDGDGSFRKLWSTSASS